MISELGRTLTGEAEEAEEAEEDEASATLQL